MDANKYIALFFLYVGFPLWLFGMLSLWRFYGFVLPRTLRAWAEENGYVYERKRQRPYFFGNPFPRESPNSGDLRAIFHISVRDKTGRVRKGWLRLGNRKWFALSVSRCPVEVRWDDAGSPVKSKPAGVFADDAV